MVDAHGNGSHPTLEGLGTALPNHRIDQREILRRAAEFFADLPGVERYLSVFENAGVETRYFCQPPDWYLTQRGWGERNEHFVRAAADLIEAASRSALRQAGRSPEEVRSLVVVTTTGLATPSLDAHLAQRLGLPPSVRRVPVWGLGCAGGVSGLGLAAELAQARSEGVSLVAAVELCSLTFSPGDRSVKQLIASSLFGDGAAAAVVAPPSQGRGFPIRARHSHLFPGSFDVMGWDVLDEGLRVVLSPKLPDVVRGGLRSAAAPLLKGEPGSVRHAPHPGGPRVLDAYAEALGLDARELEASRSVLRKYGNMSSPTALFVLDEVLRDPPTAGEKILTSAFGPGFSAEFALLDSVAVR